MKNEFHITREAMVCGSEQQQQQQQREQRMDLWDVLNGAKLKKTTYGEAAFDALLILHPLSFSKRAP